ncbi:NAD-dependent epimerase/dehydratase family protein [Amphibacillus cookii]|uniref:NAD-dependent epimerase/dehydratase family protein n=1 Tax=Amphibacillus cookii TaxID=767787 RepID=UPI0019561902|nr:NAD-dependent epimerase/dehydratase family protein [Amphibacillus cookii]MBM7539778.1 UDP-glucose 4-epimerase [Amphibacillus cookii]
MKRILITGKNSYIGNSLTHWLAQYPDDYQINSLDMRDDKWKEADFSPYDVVFHVAGIAHVSRDPKLQDLYYKVNRDLTIETAKKAKAEGVKQFIFMSSIIVYGDSSKEMQVITRETKPNPSNFYGDSKLQAEEGIMSISDEQFKVMILRPPMIYGKGSKGNYPKLAKVARKLPFFPNIDNQRSMLHIDNLTEFLRLVIDHEESGLFFPQNKAYVKTSEMVSLIAETHGKHIRLIKIFNPLIKPFINRIQLVNKVFGNLVYEQAISDYKHEYQVNDLKTSIRVTESG